MRRKKDRKYLDTDYTCGIEEFDSLDIIKELVEAQNFLTNQRIDPVGLVRGGSTGAVINNKVHGICHRVAYLRYNGINGPLPVEIELMTKQGEQNEEIWMSELKAGLEPKGYVVKDQTEFDCTWEIQGKNKVVKGSGSPDIVIFKDGLPIRGIELKNISSISKVKSANYELRPVEDHLIQSANYAIRMGDMYNNGTPIPYQLIYSNRSVWHFFGMTENIKKPILESGVDVNWYFGKPKTVGPFHRIFNLTWTDDGRMKYWTPGMKDWIVTGLTRESIDDYYLIAAEKIDENENLGPRPTTKHIDGKAAYSPCGFCDFKQVCDQEEGMKPQEFKDRCKKIVNELHLSRGTTPTA